MMATDELLRRQDGLQIKDAWADSPEYGRSVRSYDVYRSVLDDGVRTPEQFDVWRSRAAAR